MTGRSGWEKIRNGGNYDMSIYNWPSREEMMSMIPKIHRGYLSKRKTKLQLISLVLNPSRNPCRKCTPRVILERNLFIDCFMSFPASLSSSNF